MSGGLPYELFLGLRYLGSRGKRLNLSLFVWIGVGVAVLWILLARARPMNWRPPVAIACLVLGIVALAFLPWPSAWLGPLLLVMSGVIWLTSPASGAASTIAPAA